jgi:hypothetical protein
MKEKAKTPNLYSQLLTFFKIRMNESYDVTCTPETIGVACSIGKRQKDNWRSRKRSFPRSLLGRGANPCIQPSVHFVAIVNIAIEVDNRTSNVCILNSKAFVASWAIVKLYNRIYTRPGATILSSQELTIAWVVKSNTSVASIHNQETFRIPFKRERINCFGSTFAIQMNYQLEDGRAGKRRQYWLPQEHSCPT